MTLETTNQYNEAVFDFLWCPVCGHEVFHHLTFQGVFCKECNTEVIFRESNKLRGHKEGVLACFNTETTWNLHRDKMLRRDLPDGTARAKVLGKPGDYHLEWWSPKPDDDWQPVERGEFDDVEEPPEVSHLA